MSDRDVTLARLSPDQDLAGFDCGDGELNEFLCDDALGYQASFFANTTVMIQGGRIVGFFSLAADSIRLELGEKEAAGITMKLRQFPALKIARLGVALPSQRDGLGTLALKYCAGLARHLNDEHRHDGVACRFLTVDAYPQSAAWYMARGFIRNGSARSKKRETVSLRLDVMLP